MATLRLLGMKILVEREIQERTPGGLFLSQRAPPSTNGRVIAVGTGLQKHGTGLAPGQRVAMRPYLGNASEMTWEGRKCLLIDFTDILGIIPEAGSTFEARDVDEPQVESHASA